MIIAVDFDGTIVEHRYPSIGPEIPFAIKTLKLLCEDQHKLILWTVREGKLLDDAVRFCQAKGLYFYAINCNYPEERANHEGYSRKLKADLFIDDRNLGGLPDWGNIYRMIHEGESWEDVFHERHLHSTDISNPAPKGVLHLLKKLFK